MTFEVLALTASHALFPQVVTLFDDYRGHYGANPAPEATDRWLREQLTWDRVRIFTAIHGDTITGFVTVAILPAALTLRTVWMIRDLYIDPAHRRGGASRTLLAHVVAVSHAEGAHRLSLQTEIGNSTARALYASFGFEPVAGLAMLSRSL
jgi:GNAT superfamily N-acetyltransferase